MLKKKREQRFIEIGLDYLNTIGVDDYKLPIEQFATKVLGGQNLTDYVMGMEKKRGCIVVSKIEIHKNINWLMRPINSLFTLVLVYYVERDKCQIALKPVLKG